MEEIRRNKLCDQPLLVFTIPPLLVCTTLGVTSFLNLLLIDFVSTQHSIFTDKFSNHYENKSQITSMQETNYI